jgi:large subunit ribosomal protein L17
MRHNRKINHLSRTDTHRKALLSNMASSLIKEKRIFTTLAKARELRKYIEPLITKSKTDTTHSRRTVFKNLKDKYAVKELFLSISQKIGDRPGGYTRIIKTNNRKGDNAAMCLIELVDYNELLLKDKTQAKASKTRRSRRKGSSDATAIKETIPVAAIVEEEEKTESPEAVEMEIVEAEVIETEIAESESVEAKTIETGNVEAEVVEITAPAAVEEETPPVAVEEVTPEAETPESATEKTPKAE